MAPGMSLPGVSAEGLDYFATGLYVRGFRFSGLAGESTVFHKLLTENYLQVD
jgi:hypothetical protein